MKSLVYKERIKPIQYLPDQENYGISAIYTSLGKFRGTSRELKKLVNRSYMDY